ncbi:monovalent cation/H(+) antiporter subunit G [Kytococcus sedentarius]|uniref:monovalent cation/H(+) antiporter subunit G n=1 Tax=Kytococcus sedentarius TaxID=1276 RepID=UPI0035BBDCEE
MNTLLDVLDVVGLLCLLGGAVLCLSAALGLWRFNDLFSRMHAGSKPQVLGVLLVALGIGLRTRDAGDVGMLLVLAACHLITVPVAAQMTGRAALRIGQADSEGPVVLAWEERMAMLESLEEQEDRLQDEDAEQDPWHAWREPERDDQDDEWDDDEEPRSTDDQGAEGSRGEQRHPVTGE